MKIITWDYKGQPDWDEINEALQITPKVFEVDTGSDQYAIVIGDIYDTQEEAQAYYDAHRFDEVSADPFGQSATYQPEVWRVDKDVIYGAIPAVEAGLDYAKEALQTHLTSLGRTTRKNASWARRMEEDIAHMERTLEKLRACGPTKHAESPAEPASEHPSV